MKKQYFFERKYSKFLLVISLLLVILITYNFASPGRTPDGYRVQIFASKSKIDAIKIKSVYEAKNNYENVKLYIEYIDSWYKVRLGDFKVKEEAKNLCQKVKERGYPDAWIVFTVIE